MTALERQLDAELEYWRDACGVDHVQRVVKLSAQLAQANAEIERLRAELGRDSTMTAEAASEVSRQDREVERLRAQRDLAMSQRDQYLAELQKLRRTQNKAL